MKSEKVWNKTPDAIISGTAVCCGIPLITADEEIYKVEEVSLEKIKP